MFLYHCYYSHSRSALHKEQRQGRAEEEKINSYRHIDTNLIKNNSLI